jgi:hypothetical protein
MSPKKILVTVTDETGAVLNSQEYDLVKIERTLKRASGTRRVFAAQGLAFAGDAAGDMVGDEIRAALKRRGKL